jgi:hypothetical protein
MKATITGLNRGTNYNGSICTLVSWSFVKGCVRITVRVDGKYLSVKLQNLTLPTKRGEAKIISAIAKKMEPVIAINTATADPSQFFTELGHAAQADPRFTLQSFMNCMHVLALARNKHIAEPEWREVKQVLLLKSAEVLWFHNLRRSACEYAEQVLKSDPTNARALAIMKQ